MMAVTVFPTRSDTIAERMLGFMDHLRMNGMAVGPFETQASLEALTQINCLEIDETRLALKSICANDEDRFFRFDDLFAAYWLNDRRIKRREETSDQGPSKKPHHKNPARPKSVIEDYMSRGDKADPEKPDTNEDGEAEKDGKGRLIGSRIRNMAHTDLRDFMEPEDLKDAERIAERLAKAMRDRRSRRRRASKKGALIDLRKTARRSVSTGGEPLLLLKKKKPDRPVEVTALLDVSGSMVVYARVFLAFLKGLIAADQKTEAFLFHTQLVRISDPLRDGESLRAIERLSLMAQGFGGGTKIGSNLKQFNANFARQCVNGRSVILILSDGYDTDPPDVIAAALAQLKKRGCRIIWLNPLKGWQGYEPSARGMAAALPYLDHFANASTLADLAALEPYLEMM